MKELSIEEKVRRYDEAIEVISKCETDKYGCIIGIKPSDIFPELKESEGEKIRKDLIVYLRSILSNKKYGDKFIEDWIAWLEKQGDKDEEILILKDQIESLHAAIIALKEVHKIELEKRGEQQDVNIQINPSEYINDMGGSGCYLKNTTQKSTNNVEQKFKVGDWVIDAQGVSSNKIIGYEDDGYYIETSCSKFYLPMKLAEKNYHLWSIQDAKDGDVLAYRGGQWIFIFKEIENNNSIIEYYALLSENGLCIQNAATTLLVSSIFPATKEQRDLLFKKMKEAGYEWDVGKKELKKIEQPKLTVFEDAIKDMMDDYRDAIDDNAATVEEVKEHAAYLLSLIPQKSTAWSEEDEKMINFIVKLLPAQPLACKWLTSLKDRYTWKPSDEQMNTLEYYMHTLICNKHKEVLFGLYADLKKLREE